jgi:hypothetical protein
VALAVLGRWARLDFLPPALGRAFLAPSPSPLVRGFFCGKAPHRLRLCELCELDSQKRTLGDDVYRDPRATEVPLLLSEGASHGGGPSQKLAAALVRPAAIPSEGLERCCGDDRSQVG